MAIKTGSGPTTRRWKPCRTNETFEGEESVTEYEAVTLRVGDQGWLYKENTDPIEWAKAPDLADKELATDNQGWVRVKDAWVPDQEEPVEPGTLDENIQRVTAYNWQLVEADIPYFVWS